ncbi:hypothetical protein Taro_005729 [Colocasia esculenta]|uniref:Uncharacterized protein n=1 Tax=Colocasia esculenta TaxID=4460 RepID=A0A843TVF2_COLES|nr:hypothetical protein [Colocasia esculenta]
MTTEVGGMGGRISPLPCRTSPLERTVLPAPDSVAVTGVKSAATAPSSALNFAPSTPRVSCIGDFAHPPERSDSSLTMIRPSSVDIFVTASERSTIEATDALRLGVLTSWRGLRARRGSRSSSSSAASSASSMTRGTALVAFFFLRARRSSDTSSSEV